MTDKCSDCKETFDRIDLWPRPENPNKFICRNCRTISRLKKQESFQSDFRNFRERQDYVPQEETFQTNQSRISDDEFDEIIREFEQAHWTDISEEESQLHHRYIQSLFKREFWLRNHNKYKKSHKKTQQILEEPYITIHYSLLGVSENSTDGQIKDAYRRLVLKWHPDKTLMNQNMLKKCLFQLKLHLIRL